jgi:LCP family protein required for cell wall assembly
MKSISIGTILLIAAAAVLIGGATLLMVQFNTPMAQAIAISAPTATATTAPAGTVAPTVTQAPKVCGNTGSIHILVVGSDRAESNNPPGADLIRIVKVNYDQKKVTVYSLSRDLWLPTTSLADLKVDATTLGRIYDIRYTATTVDESQPATPKDQKKIIAGVQAVAQVIADDFGLVADHYVAIDVDKLPGMIDALGGVKVAVPDQLKTNAYTFAAGDQTLSGDQLRNYVSYLGDASKEMTRSERQNTVLVGLRKTLVDPAMVTKIPDLYTRFTEAIITDLSPNQITDLTCVLKQVDANAVVLKNMDSSMASTDAQGRLIPVTGKIQDMLKESSSGN